MPPHITSVSESGLQSREDLERLAAAGYRAFLIGERFMTDPDPAGALQALMASGTAAAPARTGSAGPSGTQSGTGAG